MKKTLLSSFLAVALLQLASVTQAKTDQKPQTLDQALQESIEQRITATEKFRQKYTDENKELDPFAVPASETLTLGQKELKKGSRRPATPEKKKK